MALRDFYVQIHKSLTIQLHKYIFRKPNIL